MVRSSWKCALVVLAAWAGLANAQQQSCPGCAGSGEQLVLIEEHGKPKQQCRVLYCGTMQNGEQGCKVQAIDTGEIITIINFTPPAGTPELVSHEQAAAQYRQVYRWGSNATPPAGFPAPPSDLVFTGKGEIISETPIGMDCQPSESRTVVTRVMPVSGARRGPLAFLNPRNWGSPRPHYSQPSPIQTVRSSRGSSLPRLSRWPAAHVTRPAYIVNDPVLAKVAEKTPPRMVVEKTPPKKIAKSAPQWNNPIIQKTEKLPPPPKVQTAKKAIIVDPLLNPDRFAPESVKKQFPSIQQIATEKPKESKVGPMPLPTPPNGNYKGMPPGSQSVLAATNGLQAPMRYLPVPMVTMPSPTRPPVPPPPQIPNPPASNMYVNAFTPPADPNAQQTAMNRPPMMPGYGYGGYGAQQMGYGAQPNMANMSPQQAYAMQQQMMMAYYYKAAQQMAMQSQRNSSPTSPMGMPRNYSGPTAPNPFANQQIQRVNYQQGYRGYPMPMQYANPAMDRPGISLTAPNYNQPNTVYQMLATLKTALSPSQREWVAIHLAQYEWSRSPHIVQGLLVAAKEDPAASVRAACVRSLLRMKVHKGVMGPTILALKSDNESEVRRAAHEALVQLGMDKELVKDEAETKSPILPVSKMTPASKQPVAKTPRPAAPPAMLPPPSVVGRASATDAKTQGQAPMPMPRQPAPLPLPQSSDADGNGQQLPAMPPPPPPSLPTDMPAPLPPPGR